MSMADSTMDDAMEIDPAVEIESREVMENKIINEEYKVWRKNAHFIYDTFFSRVMDFPTLTTQWFPDMKEVDNVQTHRLLFGTHKPLDAGQNYVQIAEFQKPINLTPDAADYNPETEEIGGHGINKKAEFKFNITQRIPHEGEVNKARYMPQNANLIATMCNSGKVCVFDRTKHPSQPSGDPNPDIELVGHTTEGFALHWNPSKEGQIITGSFDGTVKLWDIQGFSKASKTLKPLRTFTHHSAGVNEVEFHPVLSWMVATVSDDLTLQILDLRKPASDTAAKVSDRAHTDAINAVAFNHASEYILATGSADKTCAIWDLRNLKRKLHALEGHTDAITKIEWNPAAGERQVLGSSGQDRRVRFWDLSKVGNEQTPEDAEDGPAEHMFMHGGHTQPINDFSFNKNVPYLMCSAASNNLIHIWKPNPVALFGDDDADVPLEELQA